jgi:drug/metabolite transporter (DMT)-like permease
MEPWLFYAIVWVFFSWIYSFLIKVASMKNYNPSMVVGYSYLSWAVFSAIFLFIDGIKITDLWLIALFAFLNVIFYFLSTLTRIESMKNIDSVLFFPIFKTISPILITIIWLYFFKETLSIKEIIWIILGICVPLLLISAHENTRQINLKKGIIYLFITSLLILVSTTVIKQVNVLELNIPLFIFLSMTFGYFISVISHKSFKNKNTHKKYITKNIFWFGIFIWLFHYLSLYSFARSFEWNLAIAYTINSFSILIPIILSIIFYKDHFNLKKAFVILLSIISVILFI